MLPSRLNNPFACKASLSLYNMEGDKLDMTGQNWRQLSDKKPLWLILFLIAAAIGLNALLNFLNELLNLPLFLDTIGTATTAAVLGTLPGLVTALFTNLLFELLYGFPLIHYPFALCGLATALIVGLMAKYGCFSTLLHAVIATVLVTLANSLLGATIAAFVFSGVTGVGIDYLVTGLLLTGQSILSASFWPRGPVNLIDKSIAVFIAFYIYKKTLKKADSIDVYS